MFESTFHSNAEASFFCLLASNYLVQAVRESSVEAGAGPRLVATSAIVALFTGSIMSNRYLRNRYTEAERVSFLLLGWSFALIIFCFQVLLLGPLGNMFFVTSNVATILCASFLWGLMSSQELKSLDIDFHRVAFAATVGQAFGSSMGLIIVHFQEESSYIYLVASSAVLCLSASYFAHNLRRNMIMQEQTRREAAPSDFSIDNPKYIATIACFQLFNCLCTSLIYLVKLETLSSFDRTKASSISLYISALTSILILLLQISGATKRVSPSFGLLGLPVTTTLGILLAQGVDHDKKVVVMQILVITSRVMSYALSKPTREALFKDLSERDRIRSKALVDTVACKVGTALAPLVQASSKPEALSLLVLSLWILITFGVSSRMSKVATNRSRHASKVQ